MLWTSDALLRSPLNTLTSVSALSCSLALLPSSLRAICETRLRASGNELVKLVRLAGGSAQGAGGSSVRWKEHRIGAG